MFLSMVLDIFTNIIINRIPLQREITIQPFNPYRSQCGSSIA